MNTILRSIAMEQCIICGNQTDNVFVIHRAREEEPETQEVRSDYFTQGTRQIRRVHQKIITRFADVTEVPFGYCKHCLYANRRKGLKLLAVSLILISAAFVIFFTLHSPGRISLGDIIAAVTGFTGMLVLFGGLHFALASTKNIPYEAQKSRLLSSAQGPANMRFLSPAEYEYFKKNGMAEIRHRTVELPV